MQRENKKQKENSQNAKTTTYFKYVVSSVSEKENNYRQNVSKPLNDITYYQTRNRIDSNNFYATRGK
jgi:transcription termination factor NusB